MGKMMVYHGSYTEIRKPEIRIGRNAKDFMEGIITREQFWIMAKFKYPTHQINFSTERLLRCLEFYDCREVEA